MKIAQKSSYVSGVRLLFTMTFMVIAGIVAWWGWTHIAIGGIRYAVVGIVVVLAGALLFWKRDSGIKS